MPSRWDTVSVDGAEMRVYVSTPDGDGPFPAVVAIQHAGGVDDFVRGMCDRLAAEGFATEVVDVRTDASVVGRVVSARFILNDGARFNGQSAPQDLKVVLSAAEFKQQGKNASRR